MGGFISCERTSRNQKVVALIGRKTAGEEQLVLKKEHVTGVMHDKDVDIEFGIHSTANCRLSQSCTATEMLHRLNPVYRGLGTSLNLNTIISTFERRDGMTGR